MTRGVETVSDQQAAGWYPAPDRPGQQRYWDGSQWSDQYAPAQFGAPTQFATAGAVPVAPPKKGGAAKVLIPLVACLALAAVAIIAVVAVSAGSDDDEADSSGTTESSQGAAAAEGEDTYAVGETAETADLRVTVNTVEDPFVPTNEFDTPPDGQRYVGVEMTIDNEGDESAAFSTFGSVEVVDGENQAWNVAVTTSDQPSIDGSIPAGATRKGWLYLTVGQDSTDLQLRVKGSFTADGAVFLLG